jgi:hypothetical protein
MRSNRHLIGRRQFLAVTSASAVAVAVIGPKVFASEAAPVPRRLAIGYASFDANAAVMDGASVPAADGGFIGRGARVSVLGANVASDVPRARRTVALTAHYSYLDGAERKSVPFTAWVASRLTGSTGNMAAFTVPVDEVQKLSFTVGAESGAPRGAASRRDALVIEPTQSVDLPLTLALQNEDGAFKLARGFYVIVPMFEGDSEPRWSAYTMREVGGRWGLVDRDGVTAPFEHFVLRIDYAPES